MPGSFFCALWVQGCLGSLLSSVPVCPQHSSFSGPWPQPFQKLSEGSWVRAMDIPSHTFGERFCTLTPIDSKDFDFWWGFTSVRKCCKLTAFAVWSRPKGPGIWENCIYKKKYDFFFPSWNDVERNENVYLSLKFLNKCNWLFKIGILLFRLFTCVYKFFVILFCYKFYIIFLKFAYYFHSLDPIYKISSHFPI